MGTPPAEVEIDEALIRHLVATQAPDFGVDDVRVVANGWDNVTARLGSNHAARLPRRALGATLTALEQRWLPELATLVDVRVPAPVFVGKPDREYPWSWSIVPWIDGTTAEQVPLDHDQATAVGEFLRRLHVEAPSEAPDSPYRGSPLDDHTPGVERRWTEFRQHDELGPWCDQALAIWAAGVQAERSTSRTWGHGDLHPRNVITRQGQLAGVIDWGDVNAGDRSTDLAGVWMLLDPDVHDQFWAEYGAVDPATRRRARAWVIGFAGMFLGTGLDDDPGFWDLGWTVLHRAVAQD